MFLANPEFTVSYSRWPAECTLYVCNYSFQLFFMAMDTYYALHDILLAVSFRICSVSLHFDWISLLYSNGSSDCRILVLCKQICRRSALDKKISEKKLSSYHFYFVSQDGTSSKLQPTTCNG